MAEKIPLISDVVAMSTVQEIRNKAISIVNESNYLVLQEVSRKLSKQKEANLKSGEFELKEKMANSSGMDNMLYCADLFTSWCYEFANHNNANHYFTAFLNNFYSNRDFESESTLWRKVFHAIRGSSSSFNSAQNTWSKVSNVCLEDVRELLKTIIITLEEQDTSYKTAIESSAIWVRDKQHFERLVTKVAKDSFRFKIMSTLDSFSFEEIKTLTIKSKHN